jgi:hypothetical protein
MDQPLVKTLLGHAKGSPFGITADYYRPPIHDVALLYPIAPQIGSLELKYVSWDEAQDFSVAISGSLPLPHTLEINVERCLGGPISVVAPTLPLFKNAANLKNFVCTQTSSRSYVA